MDQDKLSPELEKLLKQVKLKEPSKDLMADYLAGVNAKINQQSGMPHFGFPQVTLILAVGLVFAGIFYFVIARPLNHDEAPAIQPTVSVISHSEERSDEESKTETLRFAQGDNIPKALHSVSIPVQEEELSLNDELALLEAFEGGSSDEEDNALGDEDLFEELALLDELEISNASVASAPGVLAR